MKRSFAAVRILTVLLVAAPAQATIFFDESFESATVPLNPNVFLNDQGTSWAPGTGGHAGAPAGWYMHRSNGLNSDSGVMPPFVAPVAPFSAFQASDNCYFTKERAHTGNISWKADYRNCCRDGSTDSSEVDTCSIVTTFPASSEIYVRFWRYLENFGYRSYSNGSKAIYMKTLGAGQPNGIIQDMSGFDTPGIAWQNSYDCGSPIDFDPRGAYSAGCHTSWDAPPNQGVSATVNGVWQCHEVHLRLNTVTGGAPNHDGLQEHWVNGQLTAQYRNLALQPTFDGGSTAQFGFYFFPYRQFALPGSVMYYDDIAVAAERIGCGSMPTDTTPPQTSITAPANGATVTGTINVTADASDNVGVAGVQFKIDGANLGVESTVPPYSTSFNSQTVSNGNHTLTAVARDAAGNTATSPPVTITVNNGPGPTCPAPADNAFTACYYNNMTLAGSGLALTRSETAINFDWGQGSPGAGVSADQFSAKFEGNFSFEAAAYEFTATADDGVRLYVDGNLIIDRWINQSPTPYKATRQMSAGTHLIRMDYYENAVGAMAKLSWANTTAASGDLNGDGAVNATDLQLEVNVILGTQTDSAIRARADLNGDGSANALDLQKLVNAVLGL